VDPGNRTLAALLADRASERRPPVRLIPRRRALLRGAARPRHGAGPRPDCHRPAAWRPRRHPHDEL